MCVTIGKVMKGEKPTWSKICRPLKWWWSLSSGSSHIDFFGLSFALLKADFFILVLWIHGTFPPNMSTMNWITITIINHNWKHTCALWQIVQPILLVDLLILAILGLVFLVWLVWNPEVDCLFLQLWRCWLSKFFNWELAALSLKCSFKVPRCMP